MNRVAVAALVSGCVMTTVLVLHAQQVSPDGPRYANGTNLIRPANYREWVFLGSTLGLTYGTAQNPPQFGTVYVNPSSYRSFLQTGTWPNGTTLVLENRNSGVEGVGRFQTTFVALEAQVKDAQFPDGWAFFNFGGGTALRESAAPIPANVGGCVECHMKNAAVERTFVQFYPALMEVARQRGTVKSSYMGAP